MRRATFVAAVMAPMLCALMAQAAAPARPTPASRALAARLAEAGRMEAALVQVVPDPLGGPAAERRGQVAIEQPRSVRLDYRDGESVTLREDGGEWLQPRLEQMLVFDAAGAGAAASAWDLLLGRDDALRARAVGPDRWRLHPLRPAPGLPDSVEVRLDAAGLPERLVAWVGGEATVEFRMSGWRSRQARGRAAFVLSAPKGFEVIGPGH